MFHLKFPKKKSNTALNASTSGNHKGLITVKSVGSVSSRYLFCFMKKLRWIIIALG